MRERFPSCPDGTTRGDAIGARETGERTLALGRALGMNGPHGVVLRAEKLLAALPA